MSEQAERANPYVGLRPYFIRDSLYFFGREEQTVELLEILHAQRFLGIVGSSGSGKSSLVRAGLLPALLGGFLVEERDHWRVVQVKPGDAPLGNLATGLLDAMELPAGAPERAALERQLADGHTEAVLEFLRPRLAANASIFLLIDQFEEIFAFRNNQAAAGETGDVPVVWTGTFAGPALLSATGTSTTAETARRRELARRRAEAADVVDLLLALAKQRELPIYVAITMRTDFLGDCDLFYGLPEALNRGRYLVPRMTRQQLGKAISGPVRVNGERIAPRLLDHLLNELGDRFDRLPVLQHALLRTWDAWTQAGGYGLIDLQHFVDAGGLEGALEKDAERALAAVKAESAGRVLRALTDTDISQRQVRRPCRISELSRSAGIPREEVEEIVRVFRSEERNFLFGSADGNAADPRIDISHESLIRQWPRLSQWVEVEREARTQFRRLVSMARSHAAGDRDLLTEREFTIQSRSWEQLGATAGWAARYSAQSDDFAITSSFIEQSGAALAAAREERLRLKAAAVRERQRRTRARVAGGAALVVTLAAGLALTYRQSQIRKRTIADAGAVVGFVSRIHAAMEPIPGTGKLRQELLDNAEGLKARLGVGTTGGLQVASTEFWERIQRGDVARRIAQPDSARAHYESALATAAREAASGNQAWERNVLIAQQSLGDLEMNAGRLDRARSRYDSALAVATRRAARAPSDLQAQHDLAVTWVGLGDVQKEQGSDSAARVSYLTALSTTRRLATSATPERQHELITGYRNLAELDLRAGQPDSARARTEGALAIAEALARANPENTQALADLSATYASLGELQKRAGQLDSARALQTRALEYALSLAADPGGHLTRSYTGLGDIEAMAGNKAAAGAWYGKALDLEERLVRVGAEKTGRRINLVLSYNRLGELELGAGQLAPARQWYTRAIASADSLPASSRENPVVQRALWISYTGLGDVASDAGESAVARGWYAKALARAEPLARSGALDPQFDLWTSQKNSGDAARDSGDPDAARRAYERAVAIIDALARQHADRVDLQESLAISCGDLGLLERAAGNAARSREWLTRATQIAERLVRAGVEFDAKALARYRAALAAVR